MCSEKNSILCFNSAPAWLLYICGLSLTLFIYLLIYEENFLFHLYIALIQLRSPGTSVYRSAFDLCAEQTLNWSRFTGSQTAQTRLFEVGTTRI